MTDPLVRRILNRFLKIEANIPTVRKGVVTIASPLTITLGGSTVPYTTAKQIDPATTLLAGDPILALMWGNDLIVLGKIV